MTIVMVLEVALVLGTSVMALLEAVVLEMA